VSRLFWTSLVNLSPLKQSLHLSLFRGPAPFPLSVNTCAVFLSPLQRHTLLFLLINLLEAKMSFRGFGSQGGQGGQSSQGDRGRGGRGGPGGPGGRGRGASGMCRTW